MKILTFKDVYISEERVRRSLDEKYLEELASSIEKQLLHPPVVQLDYDRGLYELIAGENRLGAIELLFKQNRTFTYEGQTFHDSFPVTETRDLGPDERLELELEENLKRKALTWQEEAAGMARLAELRKKQTTNKVTNVMLARETALEGQSLKSAESRVASALLLARHLNDPDVAKAKTQTDAFKIIEKKAVAVENAKRAQEISAAGVHARHRLELGDCRLILPSLTEGSIDVIIADPPYGVEAHKFGSMSDAQHPYDDSKETADSILHSIAFEGYRAARQQAHAYIFCDILFFHEIEAEFALAGWDVWPYPLIWKKTTNKGMLPLPEHAPRRNYEAILFANKGKKKTLRVADDVLEVASVARPVHGAQKPVALYLELLSRSARPGDVILDPTAGSGPVFPAANLASLRAIGIESVVSSFNLALTRIDARGELNKPEEPENV